MIFLTSNLRHNFLIALGGLGKQLGLGFIVSAKKIIFVMALVLITKVKPAPL